MCSLEGTCPLGPPPVQIGYYLAIKSLRFFRIVWIIKNLGVLQTGTVLGKYKVRTGVGGPRMMGKEGKGVRGGAVHAHMHHGRHPCWGSCTHAPWQVTLLGHMHTCAMAGTLAGLCLLGRGVIAAR